MASMTQSTSGNVTTFVITDSANNTVTMAATYNALTGVSVVFSSSGGLHADGLQAMAQALLQIATGLVPSPYNQP